MKTLFEHLQNKKFSSNTVRNKYIRTLKAKVGDNNEGGHSYPLGAVLDLSTATSIGGSLSEHTTLTGILKPNGTKGNSIYFRELIMLPANAAQLDDEIKALRKTKKAIDAEISELKDKIQFIKDQKIEEFDDETFKNWRILKEIKGNMDKLDSYEFAQTLTKLIKG